MRPIDIRQLRYFLAIAQAGQITAAARRLNLAQPHLSQELRLLEEELGVKLVERGSRAVRLTEAGRMLQNRAEQMLELLGATVKELRDFNEGLQGSLAIGTISSSGASLLPRRIRDFHRRYPGINFEVWEGNTYRILEILNRGLIEIGIVRTPFVMGDLASVALPPEPMVAAMDRDCYFDPTRTDILLAELRDKPLILYRRFESLIVDTCRQAGFEPWIFCKNDDARTTLLWADAGMGVAVVPRSAVGLIQSPKLRYKEIKATALETQIVAIWVKNRYISTAAKHFLEIFESSD